MSSALLPFPLIGLGAFFLTAGPVLSEASRSISGIYPHLAMFNEELECGTGAVVPWAGRLWAVTYAPHRPEGSTDKLYEITQDLAQIVRPESIGGTPANRLIHEESAQLFIGPYAIRQDRTVRTIPPDQMFGRHTGTARHLTDPAGKVVYATMEEGIYEVDTSTLAVTELWADEQRPEGQHAALPGYHGKGFYSAQGRYLYANNGDHAREALTNPAVPSGALAEWDGKAGQWTVVRRNQFTEVTGPGGIRGSGPEDPAWSIGWDHRSLILMTLTGGKWSAFRLPKASHAYDGAHGWNTEWPRIRDIGQDTLLMTMHGMFWHFPKTFNSARAAGIAPRSSYLKVIGDFCEWNGRLVMGCDDTAKSEFLNKDPLKGPLGEPGQSQSNLWFISPGKLDQCGPAIGRGGVWLRDDIKAGEASDPYLFAGFAHRSLHLSHHGDQPVVFTLETDADGTGNWQTLRSLTVSPGQPAWAEFPAAEPGIWIRLRTDRAAAAVTAFFHSRAADLRKPAKESITPVSLALPFASDTAAAAGGELQTRGGGLKTLAFAPWTEESGPSSTAYELTADLQLIPSPDAGLAEFVRKKAVIAPPLITADTASVLYIDPATGQRWRLPRGGPDHPETSRRPHTRLCREVCTERNLLNTHGIFYELPAINAGGFAKIRPIATHNRRIHDFTSYRGLLVMSGPLPSDSASPATPHLVRSQDGKCALWTGAVDDLWEFGKPMGEGGPWLDSAVRADTPGDPYLATGFDRKSVTLSHRSPHEVTLTIEADFTGNQDWAPVISLVIPAGKTVTHRFPGSFSAYWLRPRSSHDTTATVQFRYE